MIHFADITLAAIAAKQGRPYALWAQLHTCTPQGVGVADESQAKRIGTQLGFTGRTLTRILKAGEDLFWIRSATGNCYLRSPARVAASLKVPHLRVAFRAPIRTPIETLAVMSVAAIRQGSPTANRIAAAMLGISTRSWQAWRACSGVTTINNYALVCPLHPTASVLAIARTTKQTGLYAVRFRGRRWLVRRLPNSLPVIGARGTRQQLRRHNRGLRRQEVAGRMTSVCGGGNTRPRLFEATRSRRDGRPGPSPRAYTRAGKTDKPASAQLWQPVVPQVRG